MMLKYALGVEEWELALNWEPFTLNPREVRQLTLPDNLLSPGLIEPSSSDV